ncbi:hypothetical protein DL764_003566 [Monosporascus ibericus]|uniref:Uncharacterized protein n=1 Tax=Monosporascus ibericus TaxID=155417 RepID=A0A4Q4TJE5_9PEZI|nr:hypothetical protein DL764_003566 [Monosporascus ibericus]
MKVAVVALSLLAAASANVIPQPTLTAPLYPMTTITMGTGTGYFYGTGGAGMGTASTGFPSPTANGTYSATATPVPPPTGTGEPAPIATGGASKNHWEKKAQYAVAFTQGDPASPPAKKYLVLTCIGARIGPSSAFGIALSDALVVRNLGPAAAARAAEIDSLPFEDPEDELRGNMEFLGGSELVPDDVGVSGWVYEAKTGW